ncbi:SRPBCC family protein [Naasia sp. SYSU D00057]|uniref:SRPBCC family protein n=1 Tax=Naasia sp. SYSU D00057 TaxID=2817380 RepID=UPI001B30FB77|nr:SRPBCC family protein [Naasia sp. SYSU D00057]
MSRETRHLGIRIERDAASVYDFAGNPANLPRWAAGLSGSIEQVDGRWLAESPMGPIEVAFAPRNEYGVLDHQVTLADGRVFDNPMRVLRDGDAACDVVFTLRRADGMTDEEFAADTAAVEADLATLKRLLESREDTSAG